MHRNGEERVRERQPSEPMAQRTAEAALPTASTCSPTTRPVVNLFFRRMAAASITARFGLGLCLLQVLPLVGLLGPRSDEGLSDVLGCVWYSVRPPLLDGTASGSLLGRLHDESLLANAAEVYLIKSRYCNRLPTKPRTMACIWSSVSLERSLWRPANSPT